MCLGCDMFRDVCQMSVILLKLRVDVYMFFGRTVNLCASVILILCILLNFSTSFILLTLLKTILGKHAASQLGDTFLIGT